MRTIKVIGQAQRLGRNGIGSGEEARQETKQTVRAVTHGCAVT